MADLRFSKVVGTLPGSLTPDTFYSVRVGAGFDFYLTDITGVASKINGTEPHIALTQAEYDAIPVKDPETFYHITG